MRWFPVSRSVMKAPWGQGLSHTCSSSLPHMYPSPPPTQIVPALSNFSGKCGMPKNCFGDKSVQSTKQACGQQYSSKCIPSLTPCPCALQPVPAELIVELGAPTHSKCLHVQRLVGLCYHCSLQLSPAYQDILTTMDLREQRQVLI